MYRCLTVLASLILIGPAWSDEPKFDPAAAAKTVARFVDQQTAAVVRVDAARIDSDAVVELIARFTDWDNAEKTEVRATARMVVKELLPKFGVRQVYWIASLHNPLHPDGFVVPCDPNADPKLMTELFQKLNPIRDGDFRGEIIDGVFLAGSKTFVTHLKALRPEARPELAKAFAAASEADAQIVFIPSKDHRRVAEELNPTLPTFLGGGSVKIISRGLLWAAVGIEAAPKFNVRLTIQSENDDAAKALKGRIPMFMTLAGAAAGMAGDPFAGKLIPEVAGDQLHLESSDAELAAGLARIRERAREAASIGRRENNLKQIGIAFHNYHNTYGRLPARAGYGRTKLEAPAMANADRPDWTTKPKRDSKPMLSWRVFLLPFVEQQHLFNQFKLDEPWDSEDNKKLIAQMPAVFHSGNRKLDKAGKTRIVVPVGKGTIFEPDGPGIRIPQDIPDGTAKTILVLEAAEANAVIWTKPDDLEIDEKNPIRGVFNPGADFALVGMADGTVNQLPNTIKPQTLLWMFLRDDGHVIEWP